MLPLTATGFTNKSHGERQKVFEGAAAGLGLPAASKTVGRNCNRCLARRCSGGARFQDQTCAQG